MDLTVDPGEVVALVGPSGPATTLLIRRVVEQADAGGVAVGGEDCSSSATTTRTKIRRGAWASFTKTITCCRNSRPGKTVVPQIISGLGKSERARGPINCWRPWVRRSRRPPARKAVGRRTTAVAIGRALANAPGLLLAGDPRATWTRTRRKAFSRDEARQGHRPRRRRHP